MIPPQAAHFIVYPFPYAQDLRMNAKSGVVTTLQEI